MLVRQLLLPCMGGALLVLLVLLRSSSRPSTRSSLVTSAEIDFITQAEQQDSSPKGLTFKNDDGHTSMWNAASDDDKASNMGKKVARRAASPAQGKRYTYGYPRFFAHSLGWVQDYDDGKDQFGLPKRRGRPAQLSVSPPQMSQILLQKSPAYPQLSAQQKAKALAEVQAWETKELRKSFPDPSAAAAKKAAAQVWHSMHSAKKQLPSTATKSRLQKLWNAAHNDEITLGNIGHLHPSDMSEIARHSPEFKTRRKHAHITSKTHMDYEPLKWMHEQSEPGALNHRKPALAAVKKARFQQLWNAAANDDHFTGFKDNHGGYHPIQWLSKQKDDAEMHNWVSNPSPSLHRTFRTDADHQRNYEGSYVKDNSIGVEIDNLKAPETMLAQIPEAQAVLTQSLDSAGANDAIIKQLDDLRNMAFTAYGNLDENAPEHMRYIAAGDYEALKKYLDEVAAQATGIPRGNSTGNSTAAKSPVGMLKGLQSKDVSELVLALDRGISEPLNSLKPRLAAAHDQVTRTNLVVSALNQARLNAEQILSDPKAAHMAAEEDIAAAERREIALERAEEREIDNTVHSSLRLSVPAGSLGAASGVVLDEEPYVEDLEPVYEVN
eukprot:766376-Hanusia_phi.AAC.4